MERYNIYHRKDGRWEGRLLREITPDGKRKYEYFYGQTRDEVYDKIRRIRSIEPISQHCTMTLTELVDEWKQSVLHCLKESTIANYLMKLNKHILPVFGSESPENITAADIYDFIRDKKSGGLSNRYISDIIVLMKTIFKYAKKIYHTHSPLDEVELPRKKKAEIRLLDNKEQKKLLKFIGENPNNTTLGVALSNMTGIRLGELCALRWENVDLEKRIITVSKTMQRIQCSDGKKKTKLIITEPKSESSCREIPIPDCMMSLLRQFQGESNDFVLSDTDKPVEPRTMQYRFAAILKNAKLPSIHFHALRHMFASNCIALGFDVKSLSEILGHSSVEITVTTSKGHTISFFLETA